MIRNTEKDAQEHPLLGLFDAMNIPAAEKHGQIECENSSQLPAMIGRNNDYLTVKKEYERHGIQVINPSKGDNLFLDVVLPDGWKIKGTEHAMWNNVLDENNKIRATFFYKAAFYDRDAFLSFKTRYDYRIWNFLPQEKTGHYKTVKVEKIIKPRNHNGGERGVDGRYYFRNEWGEFSYERERTEIVEEQVWVPRFKNTYSKYNAAPHYFEITDGNEVIYSTKDNPIFFKRKFNEKANPKTKQKWWRDFEAVSENLRIKAKKYLDENFPGWEDTTKYFN